MIQALGIVFVSGLRDSGFELGLGYLRALGGTPNGDPCSLLGLTWGLLRDIGAI